MSICYVCLEPSDTTSPCVCGAPLHRGCLFELHCRGFHGCTLCGERLESVDWLLFAGLLWARLCYLKSLL